MRQMLGLVPVVLISSLAVAQNPAMTSPWAGNWVANVRQSKLHAPGLEEEAITIQPPNGDSLTVSYEVTGMMGNGQGFNAAVDGKADGQPYPVTSDGRQIATEVWHRETPYRYSDVETLTDGTTISATHTLDRNGKRFTTHSRTTGPGGTYEETLVWDRTS
jgi:hypothetical protein